MNTAENQINENMLVAQKIFNSQIKNARDYKRQEIELGFLTEKGRPIDLPFPDEDTIKTMVQHPFVIWLRKQPGFIEATQKLATDKPIVIKRTNVLIIDKYVRQFTLERLCAFHVCLFTDHESILLDQAVVHQEDRDTAVGAAKALLTILDQGRLCFENGAKQLVVRTLLRDLLKNPGNNIYSSRKKHPSLLRQVFTKFIAQALLRTYERIATGLVVNIALDISSIFFRNVMDKRDLERIIQEISFIVDDENTFVNKTILQLLNE